MRVGAGLPWELRLVWPVVAVAQEQRGCWGARKGLGQAWASGFVWPTSDGVATPHEWRSREFTPAHACRNSAESANILWLGSCAMGRRRAWALLLTSRQRCCATPAALCNDH